jgi:hypothetical protein
LRCRFQAVKENLAVGGLTSIFPQLPRSKETSGRSKKQEEAFKVEREASRNDFISKLKSI